MVGIFQTAKKRQHYITDKRVALDHEYATTDRPKYHLPNMPLTVAPTISVRAGRAYKVPVVQEVRADNCDHYQTKVKKIVAAVMST